VENLSELVVPSVSIYEVFKRVLQQRDESDALRAVAVMQQGLVVDLDAAITLSAAQLSVELGLPMADSLVLATARAHDAVLWTQDAGFEGIDNVQYTEKR
jgi:predicted nucleic acid-binding protein